MSKKIIIAAKYSIIEPLSLIYLLQTISKCNFKGKAVLIKPGEESSFLKEVEEYDPDFVGINVYTGYHNQSFELLRKVSEQVKRLSSVGLTLLFLRQKVCNTLIMLLRELVFQV